MKVKKMSKDEIEALSYLDIAYEIINQGKETRTTVDLFKEICSLLELSDEQYESLIGDFYTSLTVDKRFLLLDTGKWDLKKNHSIKLIVEDELDELDGIDIIEEIDEEDEIQELEGEETGVVDEEILDDSDILDDSVEGELDELTILDEEDLDQTDL